MTVTAHDPLCPYLYDGDNTIWTICQCPLIKKVVERERNR